MKTLMLIMILSLNVSAANRQTIAIHKWARVPATENPHDVAKKACGSYELTELGLIEGKTKIVRFTCTQTL